MSLTRTEYAHAKYPWDYTTGELLSLFEIDRDSQLLSPGEWQESGIIESLKMLEQQLRYLTKPAYHRNENFSGYQGSISFLYSSNAIPTLAIQGLSHSGSSVGFIMDWIDAIRSDYGLSAWAWSNQEQKIFNIDLVKELWYATGLLHQNIDWDSGKRQVHYAEPPASGYYWGDIYYYGPANEYLYSHPSIVGHIQRILAFGEDSRTAGTKTLLLFSCYSESRLYSGTQSSRIYLISESSLSDPQTAYLNTGILVTDAYGGSGEPTNGTGFNCTWKVFDITEHHPVGSGDCYYKAVMDASDTYDISTFTDMIDLSATVCPVYLWQTVISNPYS